MKFSSFALALAVVASAGSAHAARQLSVTLSGCAAWSSTEVERLAELELATVGGGESDIGGASVLVACAEASLVITATEPRSRRALSRNVQVAANAEDGERLIAISVAQLVRALDWLPEPQPAPERLSLVLNERRVAPRQRSRRLELDLAAGPRARDHHAPFATYRGALGSTYQIAQGYRVGGTFSYERGHAERNPGQVRAELLGVALQIDVEPWRGRHWSCLFRLHTGLAWLALRGLPSDGATLAQRLRGLGVDTGVGVGPALRWPGLGVALLAQAGAGEFGGGRGLVSGAQSVNLNGLWGGAELSLLWSP